MAGVPGLDGDQPLRAPMSWTGRGGFSAGAPFRPHAPNVATHNAESQAQDPGSIFGFYRAMIGLRNRHAAIALGSFEHSFADGLVLGFQRRWQRDHVLVLINYGQRSAEANVMALPPRSRLVPAYPPRGRGARADAAGRATVSLAPLSVRVLSVRR
jgi:glycosidase